MNNQPGKLGDFLREVSNWRWDDFVVAEKDDNYTTNQSLIFALIRAAAMEQLPAIQTAINRLDGKLKTPVRIETPKVYYIYPYAKEKEVAEKNFGILDAGTTTATTTQYIDLEEDADELPSLSLRETVDRMSDFPRETPKMLASTAGEIDRYINNNQGEMPEDIPLVKSVVAAHLLIMAQNRNLAAIGEVFDQIDGKLVETIKLLGDDMYIKKYDLIAPENAYLNENGVLQCEAEQAQATWAAKLVQ